MTRAVRHAVYYAPRPGALADRTAAWLGWDAATGRAAAHPDLPLPLAEITAGARKYGFHGTLRAPFRAAAGLDDAAVAAAVAALAARLPPARADGLKLAVLDGFLALVPAGDTGAIDALAAAVVEGTDHLRAPLTEAEIARRRPDLLTPRQRDHLARWGYPHVMDEFRFHLTLTDRLANADTVAPLVWGHLADALPQPFWVQDLCLFAEDAAGRFHLTHRYALTG